MIPKLIVQEGEYEGLALEFEGKDEWVIGRDPDLCDFTLEDASTSRTHLLCRMSPEGIIAENLSETNPAILNENILTAPSLLKNGDVLQVGSIIFHYQGKEILEPEEKTEEEEHESIYGDMPEDEEDRILADINFDLKETGRWLLKVIGGPNNGAEFSMHPGHSYLVGNDPTTCDIVFHDTSVSREHAKVSVTEENTLILEDLGSRNGTLIESRELKGSEPLDPNTIVTLGTTSFIIFDREGEMQTIISPMLPSIVQMLKKEEEDRIAKKQAEQLAEEEATLAAEKAQRNSSPLLLIALASLFFIIIGVGTTTLFQIEELPVQEEVDHQAILKDTFIPYPTVQFNFNRSSGHLFLVGHVLRQSDMDQLMNQLRGISFIKSIDDGGVIIDELVWRETNQIMQRDPRWRGISIHSPSAGQFVLSGYLKTRTQSAELSDYMTANFPYLDLLERNVIVEENVLNQVNGALENAGIRQIEVSLQNNGELTLTGSIPRGKKEVLEQLLTEFGKIRGIRRVKTFLNELEQEQSLVNLTGRYLVSGFSRQGSNISVIIDGRILTKGDLLDGMVIEKIDQQAIFLEKDGVKYRIDYK